MRRRSWAVLVVALLGGLLAAGCAIPTQQSPQTIPDTKVPLNLMDPHLPSTTTTLPNLASYVAVKVYFLNSTSQLQAESRLVPLPAPLKSILDALLAGPSEGEAATGVQTQLPHDVAVLSTRTAGNVVTVDMNTAFGQITGPDAELAVGQIVATVAEATNGVNTGVLFEVDGERTAVPISNGSEVASPVNVLQYLS